MTESKAVIDTNVLVRLFVKDDRGKAIAIKRMIQRAMVHGDEFYIPSIVLFELVWVLDKHYKMDRGIVREYAESVLNTPVFRCEMENVFRNALEDYSENNVKFADAVIANWSIDKGITTVVTYDDRDFKRLKRIAVRKP